MRQRVTLKYRGEQGRKGSKMDDRAAIWADAEGLWVLLPDGTRRRLGERLFPSEAFLADMLQDAVVTGTAWIGLKDADTQG